MKLNLWLGDKWGEVPLPVPLMERATVYHYTGAAGLLGILDSGEFWASSPLALNDLSEVTYGLHVFRRATEGRSDAASLTLRSLVDSGWFNTVKENAYCISASKLEDSLTHWIGYGGVQGYALGIDTGVQLAQEVSQEAFDLRASGLTDNRASVLTVGAWYEVLYTLAEQTQVVTKLLDFLVDTAALYDEDQQFKAVPLDVLISNLFSTLLLQFKHPAFGDEREVRFIVGPARGGNESYRSGLHGVVPYARLFVSGDRGYVSVGQPRARLPLVSVTTGPSNSDEAPLIRSTIERVLMARGYEGVAVKPSSIPYRSSWSPAR